MAELIIMPKQGLQMTEGTITRWFADEGQTVTEGAELFEMETDKLTISIPSTAGGTLLKILHGPGETVPITKPIAVVGQPGEDIGGLLQEGTAAPETGKRTEPAAEQSAATRTAPVSPVGKEGMGRILSTPRARSAAEQASVPIARIPGSGPGGMIIERDVLSHSPQAADKATPLARKLAETKAVNLQDVTGSGARGKIIAGDVLAAAQRRGGERPPRGEILIPLNGMRRVVSVRMKESLAEMAQANHRITVNMTEAVALREKLKEAQVKVSYNDIVLRCVARALTEHPAVNASWAKDGIVQKEYVNLGMAVAVEDGLLVPVIRDADLLTLTEIAARSTQLAQRAKDNQLAPDECAGGTFTVTNLGMFDIDSFTAIINPPEAGILAVGKLAKQPVAEGDTLAIRPVMQLCLTYDHRIVDGAPAARFLQRIKALLETPALMI